MFEDLHDFLSEAVYGNTGERQRSLEGAISHLRRYMDGKHFIYIPDLGYFGKRDQGGLTQLKPNKDGAVRLYGVGKFLESGFRMGTETDPRAARVVDRKILIGVVQMIRPVFDTHCITNDGKYPWEVVKHLWEPLKKIAIANGYKPEVLQKYEDDIGNFLYAGQAHSVQQPLAATAAFPGHYWGRTNQDETPAEEKKRTSSKMSVLYSRIFKEFIPNIARHSKMPLGRLMHKLDIEVIASHCPVSTADYIDWYYPDPRKYRFVDSFRIPAGFAGTQGASKPGHMMKTASGEELAKQNVFDRMKDDLEILLSSGDDLINPNRLPRDEDNAYHDLINSLATFKTFSRFFSDDSGEMKQIRNFVAPILDTLEAYPKDRLSNAAKKARKDMGVRPYEMPDVDDGY